MRPQDVFEEPSGYQLDRLCARMRPSAPATADELARATACSALLHGEHGREAWVPARLLDRHCGDRCVVIVVGGETRRVHEERVR